MGNIVQFNPSQLPQHLRDKGVSEQTRQLAGGSSGYRISIKGGVFRLLDSGKEIARNEDRSMPIVIIKSAAADSRAYYKDKYEDGDNNQPPTCWSADGVTPDTNVKTPQGATCALCPQNIAGSGTGESRACRFFRNIAVMTAKQTAANTYEVENERVYKMTIPAKSLYGKAMENGYMPLKAYGQQVAAYGTSVECVLTEMKFDTSAESPKLMFKPIRFLNEEETAAAELQGESAEALQAVAASTYHFDTGNADGKKGSNLALAAPEAPKIDSGAATKKPLAVDPVDDEADDATLLAEMERIKQRLNKKKAVDKAVVVPDKSDTTIPQETAQMLSSWDTDEA